MFIEIKLAMHHCFHKEIRAVSNAGIAITGSGRPAPWPGHVTQCVPGPELTAPIISCTESLGWLPPPTWTPDTSKHRGDNTTQRTIE